MKASGYELTIVHCGDAARAEDVADFLQNWSEAGLIEADLWVVTGKGTRTTGWQARPVCFVDPYHDAINDEIASALAARVYARWRLINVRFVGEDTTADDDGWSEIHALMARSEADLPNTHFTSVNLVVPLGADVTGVPVGLVEPDADANLVAAPEDRRSSQRSPQPFQSRDDDPDHHRDHEFHGWAAQLASTVGGLWTGTDENPFDGLRFGLIDGRPSAAVVRGFLRVLDGGFFVDHIGAGLIGRFDEWPFPSDLDHPDDLFEARPDAIEEIPKRFLQVDGGALLFHRLPRKRRPEPHEITWWRAFANMFRFIWAEMRRAPMDFLRGAYDKAQGRAASWVQSAVYGDTDDTKFIVTFGGRRADGRRVGAKPHTPKEIRSAAEGVFAVIGDRNPPPPSPTTWRSFRQLVLGLADGGPLPDLGEASLDSVARQGASRLVVRSPERLAPDPVAAPLVLHESLYRPGQPLEGWAPNQLRSSDPLGCAELLDALSEAIEALDVAEPAEDAESSQDGRRIAAVESPLKREDLPPPVAEDAVGAESPSFPGEPEKTPPAAAAAPAQPSDDPRRALWEQSRAAIREYAVKQRKSIVWRVGEGITSELRAAIAEYLRSLAALEQGPPTESNDEQKKAKRRLFRSWGIAAVVAVVVALGGWLVVGVTLLLLGPLALVAALLGWLRSFARYEVEMHRLQNRDLCSNQDFEYAQESAVRSSYEALKLIDRYEEYLSWAEILGGFVHRPWGQPEALAPSTVDVDFAGVPRSMTVARGYVEPRKVKAIRARALRDIIRVNWMSNQFAKVADAVLDDYAQEKGLRRDRDVVEPEEDTRRGDESTREALLRAIVAGGYSRQAREELEQQVTGYCARLAPSEIFEYAQVELRPGENPSTVAQQGREGTAVDGGVRLAPLTNAGSSGGLDVRLVVRDVIDSVVHIANTQGDEISSGSGVVIGADGLVVTNAHVVEGATAVAVQFSNGTVADAEVVGSRPEHDIAVIRVAASDLSPARRSRSSLLEVGEAVVAVGNPAGLSGGPSVSLGIVSALNRKVRFDEDHELHGMVQTDAAISPGSSGGGLFDNGGELVGITTAGHTSAQGIGYAISVATAIDVVNDITDATVAGSAERPSSPEPSGAAAPASPERPKGMVFPDLDQFFTEVSPGASEGRPRENFGRSCWPPGVDNRHAVDRTMVWTPPTVPTITGTVDDLVGMHPPTEIGRKLVYVLGRFDLSAVVESSVLETFDDGSSDNRSVSSDPTEPGRGGLLS